GGPSGWCHCRAYLVASAGRADSVGSIARPGLASFHRANAGRHSCRHTRDRAGRSEERRPPGCGHPCALRRKSAEKSQGLSQKADRGRAGGETAEVKTEIVSAVRAGLGFSGSETDDPSQTGATVLVRAESSEGCAKAIKLLRGGEVVALPTETVYGLAADALKPGAVAKIFEAKERPRFDPLIVHLPNRGALDEFAIVES